MRIESVRWQTLAFFLAALALPARADPLAHAEARADQARATYGVSGANVIVAVFDRGIDWRHDDFRNADGTTRIEAILDLSDDSGKNAPGNPYGVGTLYTRTQINSALSGGTQLVTRDAVGHGTATAGGCCGNGRASVGGKYIGLAPNATLLIVKMVTEGAAAHGSVPAEAPYNGTDRMPQALQFVKDTSARLQMPAVVLWNFGSIGGSTDGEGKLAKTIDATVGPGKPGLVIVTGNGDDGGGVNHASGVVTSGTPLNLQLQKGATNAGSNLRLDLWYSGADRFDVTVTTPTGVFGPYAAPAPGATTAQTTADFRLYHYGELVVPAQNGKRQILIDINGPAGTYTVQLSGTGFVDGRFHASLNPARTVAPASLDSKFLSFAVPGYSIWDAATARNNIALTDYYFKNWQGGTTGNLWPGSSVGPTYDGRLGTDISAPGEGTIVAMGADSYWSTLGVSVPGGNGKYVYHGAVSGAAPVVTGVIALMLEKNPQLDAAQVKSILQRSARSDAFTGATPNPSWGYGKLDALAALKLVADAVPATVVEYYNQGLDHYFITHIAAEIALLDAGTTIKGWTRTGKSFKAYPAAQAGTTDICRIYIIPARGDSHFFGRGATECNATMAAHPDFVLEDGRFMAMFLPTLGTCPAGTQQVYRVFSNRPDANHRYMTDKATRDAMAAKGWLVEGDGPDAVVMCAPV
ncbi:MAG: S8 family serine peptidase [Burkholderiales bacterium]